MFWAPVDNGGFKDKEELNIEVMSASKKGRKKKKHLYRNYHWYVLSEIKRNYSREHALRIYRCEKGKNRCEAKIYERILKKNPDGKKPMFRLSFEKHKCDLMVPVSNPIKCFFIDPPPRSENLNIDNRDLPLPLPPLPKPKSVPERFSKKTSRELNKKKSRTRREEIDEDFEIPPPPPSTSSTPRTPTSPHNPPKGRGQSRTPRTPTQTTNFTITHAVPEPLERRPYGKYTGKRKRKKQTRGIHISTATKLLEEQRNISPSRQVISTSSSSPSIPFNLPEFEKVSGRKRTRNEQTYRTKNVRNVNEAIVKFYPTNSESSLSLASENGDEKVTSPDSFLVDLYCNFGNELNSQIILEYPFERRVHIWGSNGVKISIIGIHPTVIKSQELYIQQLFINLEKEDGFIPFVDQHSVMFRCKIETFGRPIRECEIQIRIPNKTNTDVDVVKAVGFLNETKFAFSHSNSESLLRLTALEEEEEEEPVLQQNEINSVDTDGYYRDVREVSGMNEYQSEDFLLPEINFRGKKAMASEIAKRFDPCGLNLLHYASAHGDLKKVQQLTKLQTGGKPRFLINKIDHFGHTALHFASYHNRPEISRYLISTGAVKWMKNIFGYSSEDIEVVRYSSTRFRFPKRMKIGNSLSVSKGLSIGLVLAPKTRRRKKQKKKSRSRGRGKRAVTPNNAEEYVPRGRVVRNAVSPRVTRSNSSGNSPTGTQHMSKPPALNTDFTVYLMTNGNIMTQCCGKITDQISSRKSDTGSLRHTFLPHLTHHRSPVRYISKFHGQMDLSDSRLPWSSQDGVVLENVQDCVNVIFIPLWEDWEGKKVQTPITHPQRDLEISATLERVAYMKGKKETPNIELLRIPQVLVSFTSSKGGSNSTSSRSIFKGYRGLRTNPEFLFTSDGMAMEMRYILNNVQRTKKTKGVNRFTLTIRDKRNRMKKLHSVCYFFKKDNRNEKDIGHIIGRKKFVTLIKRTD